MGHFQFLKLLPWAALTVIFCPGLSWAQDGLDGATIAHWRFDGEPGTPFTEEISNQAKLTGGVAPRASSDREPIYGEPAPVGGKSSLLIRNHDTSGNNGGYAWSADVAMLISGGGELTVEAWIKPNELQQAAIFRVTSPGRDEEVILETQLDGRFGFLIMSGKEIKTALISKGGALISGEWQHVAGIFQNGALSLYLNGKRIGMRPANGMDTLPDRLSVAGIGAYVRKAGEDIGQFFDGNIDEVRISNRALAPDDFLLER